MFLVLFEPKKLDHDLCYSLLVQEFFERIELCEEKIQELRKHQVGESKNFSDLSHASFLKLIAEWILFRFEWL